MVRSEKWSLFRSFVFVLIFFVGLGSMSGCASFRKKFIRKSKAKSQDDSFIPVLQPIDYKAPELVPSEVYADHYMLVKAYFKDLWEVMGSSNAGDKQQVYILTQLTMRLQGMADLLIGPKKAELEQIIMQLKDEVKLYDKPQAMRRYDIMKIDTRRIEAEVRKDFKPEQVKDLLLPMVPKEESKPKV